MSLTASSALNVIVVENHDALRDATVAALRAMGHAVLGAGRAEPTIKAIRGIGYQALVSFE